MATTEAAAKSVVPTQPKVIRHITWPDSGHAHWISGAEVHRYGFQLKAGQILEAWVQQDPVPGYAVDVAVRLYLPADHLLYEINNPTGSVGAERIFVLATKIAELQIEIDGEGAKGFYKLDGVKMHRASASDKIDARAEELFYDARAAARRQSPNVGLASNLYLRAERLWSSIGNKRGEANALERRITLLDLAKTETSDQLLSLEVRALRLYQEAGDKYFELKMRFACANSKRKLGRLKEAESGFREVIAESEKFGVHHYEVDAWMRLGSIYRQRGLMTQALNCYDKALQLSKSENSLDKQFEILNIMGITYETLGDYLMVRKCYEDAGLLVSGNPGLNAQLLTRFAELYEKLKQPRLALKYALQAPSQRQLAHDSHGLAVSLGEIGLAYRDLGDFSRARAFHENSLAIFQTTKDRQGEAIAHYNLGLDFIDEMNYQRAGDHFRRCQEISSSVNFSEGELDCFYGMAQAEDRRGNPLRARGYAEKAVDIGERLPRRTGNEGNDPSSDAAREGAHELLVRLLVASPAQFTGPAEVAHSFEISERSRGRTLLESLASEQMGSGWLKGADPRLLAEFESVRGALEKTAKQAGNLSRKGLPVGPLLAELNEQLTSLEARLRAAAPWPDAVQPALITLVATQRMLDPNSTLIEYLLGSKRSFVWVVTTDSATIVELPSKDVIESGANDLYKAIQERSSHKWKMQAAHMAVGLSDMLLRPLKSHLRKHLLIVPDGALQYVPFAALPDPSRLSKADNPVTWPQPLIVDHDVTYLPSASVLHAIRKVASSREAAPRSIAIFSNPAFDPEDYPSLPFSGEEAARVRALFATKGNPLVAEGSEASLGLVRSGMLRNFRFLLFATHGLNYPEQPNLSGIALSQRDSKGNPIEGELRLPDIKRLDLRADLVVLSACKTAPGSEIHGEGFVGLTQGFLYAGASRVVVSLWNVNDQAAPELIERFFKGIQSKSSPAESLRQAQLWMYQQGNSPYLWGGFELHGEYR